MPTLYAKQESVSFTTVLMKFDVVFTMIAYLFAYLLNREEQTLLARSSLSH